MMTKARGDSRTIRIMNDAESHGADWWRWSIWIEGTKDALQDVVAVTYHLDPTFPAPVQTVDRSSPKFMLRGEGWGEFEVTADLAFRDGRSSRLTHWLELKPQDSPLLRWWSSLEAPVSKSCRILRGAEHRHAVFVMASIAETPIISELRRLLAKRCIDVITAQDIDTEAEARSKVVRHALNCVDAVVVIIASPVSRWLEEQADEAREVARTVIPLLIDGAKLPPSLRGLDALRVDDGKVPPELIEALVARLGTTDELLELVQITHQAIRLLQRRHARVVWPAWCEAGEDTQRWTWDAVEFGLRDPRLGARHEQWCSALRREGWSYAALEDGEQRTHPALVPFHELPEFERARDTIVISLVTELAPLLGIVPRRQLGGRELVALSIELMIARAVVHSLNRALAMADSMAKRARGLAAYSPPMIVTQGRERLSVLRSTVRDRAAASWNSAVSSWTVAPRTADSSPHASSEAAPPASREASSEFPNSLDLLHEMAPLRVAAFSRS
jgi:hypothetical protein